MEIFKTKLNSIQFADKKDKSELPDEIQIIRSGKFNDSFETFTIDEKMLQSFKVNFDAKVRGVDLALDYSHSSWAEAAGWFKSVEVRDGQLWAKVDFTPKAQQKIKDKEFRYLSAEFTFDHVDNETGQHFGPTLYGAGLTNRPFVKQMEATTELSEGKAIKMDVKKLEENVEQLTKKLSGVEAENKKLSDENAKLKSDAVAREAEVKKESRKLDFDKMLSEGKACEAQREAYMNRDMDKFVSLSSDKPHLKAVGHDDGNSEDVTLDADKAAAKVVSLAEKLEGEGYSYNDAVQKVLSDNPELEKVLY